MKKTLLIVIIILTSTFFYANNSTGKIKSLDGVEISYSVEGNGGSAIVFIHGWSCNESYWKDQIKKLTNKYTVVAIDLAGHGLSGKERKDYTMELFGEDVAAVVNHLNLKKVILVGHSMGGSVIIEAASLLKNKVVGLIGVDTYQSFTDDWTSEQKEQFLLNFKNDFKQFTVKFVKGMFPQGADSLLADKVANDMSSAQPEVAISAMKNLMYYDPLPTLSKIQLPMISINCEMYPLSLDENRKHVQSFSFKMMKGVGHFLMLEKPDEFGKLLNEAISELSK